MTNVNPRDQYPANPATQSDFDPYNATHPAPTGYPQRRANYGSGFLVGFLSSSVLWLLLGGIFWFTQSRNATQPIAIAPVAPAVQAPQSAPAETANPSGAQSSTTPSDSTQSDSASSGTTAAQPQVEQAPALTGLNLQRNHPNGTTLRVEQVKFAPDSITVAMSVTNGADFDITLNPAGRGMSLQDDQGNSYNLSAPPANREVDVPSKTTARGEFVFLGSLPANATKLTLVTNLENGGSNTNRYTRRPTFRVGDIPVKR
jgi:hypothetical protein